MGFVIVENLVPVAIFMPYCLFPCIFNTKFVLSMWRGDTSFISSIIVTNGNTSGKADGNSMYSASAVLRAISVCKELRQYFWQLEYMMTIPVHDMTLSALLASAYIYPPEKSVST